MVKKGIFTIIIVLMNFVLCIAQQGYSSSSTFVHPGILFTKTDLDLVKNNQTLEPWKSALNVLKATEWGSLNYAMKGPYLAIYRGSDNSTGWTQHGKDAQACYVQALLWYFTDNSTYANNAIKIIDAWSAKLQTIGGHDVELLAGIQGPLWALAGEILANSGTNSGWDSTGIVRAKKMLTEIFLPAMDGFDPDDGANFSNACVFSTMAIAVFTDNQAKFDEAWQAFISTDGCPNDFSLFKNIAANGQNVESGRDQIHSWSSYEMLSGTAEIAYNQGKDPWVLGDNRLLTGVEYWCKYNLGNNDVPWDRSVYRCRPNWGPWDAISSINRGLPTGVGFVVNMVHRAYKRLGLHPFYTEQMMSAVGNTMVAPQGGNGWGNPFMADPLLYNSAPVITSEATVKGVIGQSFSYAVTATNFPTNYKAVGLPKGLNIDTITGGISGIPTTSGRTTATIYATNSYGTGQILLFFNIAPSATSPVITSATVVNGIVGSVYSYTISATNSPESFSATGLPSGFDIDTISGVISGTSAIAGVWPVFISATNSAGTGTDSLIMGISSVLLSPWQQADIGSPWATGSVTLSNDTFTIYASGGGHKMFKYVYQSFTGDCQIIAKVLDIDNADGNGKVGVMIRESLEPNSAYAALYLTPQKQGTFESRTATGDSVFVSKSFSIPIPYWVKIARTGNTVTAYRSSKGGIWSQIGIAETFSMKSDVFIGFSACNQLDGSICTAQISEVSVSSITTGTYIEETLHGVEFYPNPVTNVLTINLYSGSNDINVKVFDLRGVLVKDKNFTGTTCLVDMGKLPGGNYNIKITDRQNTFSGKVIKK